MAPILVTGATGNVGRPTVEALLAQGAAVRLATRSGRQDPLLGANAHTVAFDFLDTTTWGEAFDGVESMFLVRPPAVGNVKRDLLPAVAAGKEAGVKQVVFLSLQGVEKNKVVPHARVEAWLRQSGMEWTFLRASFFDQNLNSVHGPAIRDDDEIVVPAGNGATAFVDANDVGAVAAAALLNPGAHSGKAYTVTGPEALTYWQVAHILTGELGRPIRYRPAGLIEYARHARDKLGMPWPMVAVTVGIYTTARLGLAAGLSDDARDVLGREPTNFAAFAHRERDAWIWPE
jgi:uncharacterized protein YbjT (DUF2867 family)